MSVLNKIGKTFDKRLKKKFSMKKIFFNEVKFLEGNRIQQSINQKNKKENQYLMMLLRIDVNRFLCCFKLLISSSFKSFWLLLAFEE